MSPLYFEEGEPSVASERLAAAMHLATATASFVEHIDTVVAETEHPGDYIVQNADEDPLLREVRTAARQEAGRIFESNMQLLRDGEYDQVPLDVDPGGTARKLVLLGKVFGKDSTEYHIGWQGLVRDCGRRIAEASRMKGWELYDVTTMQLDTQTRQIFSDGFSVDEMLRNGLTPAVNPHYPEEPLRRINEFVELKTDAALVARPEMQGRSAFVLSQCPQSVIDRYRQNPEKEVVSDYAPSIEKQMIRYKLFDPEAHTIHMQQMGVPGLYINNEVVNSVLASLKVTDGQQLDRTEVQGTQVVVAKGVFNTPVDVLRLLDREATRQHGIQIFIGMPLKPGQEADYGAIFEEAYRRRQEQEDLTQRYAHFLIGLEESGIDRELVGEMADKFVQAELLKIAREDPTKAEIMFNRETADGLMAVKQLESLGRTQEANILYAQVAEKAPQAGGCGAGLGGSCRLETIGQAEMALAAQLLNLQPGEQTARNTKDPCIKCGEVSIVYAWTDRLVKKACLSCKATEGVTRDDNKEAQPFSVTVRRQDGEIVTIKQTKEGALVESIRQWRRESKSLA